MLDNVQAIFDEVWRFDFKSSGFYQFDFGSNFDSHALRRTMLGLKEALSMIALQKTGKPFIYQSMGRFDQQVTTKFHRDNTLAESLLLLGYEPSRVHSRIMLADHTRCAFDLGIEPDAFFERYNPMYRQGEEILRPYVTELPQPADAHFTLLLVNNSSLPFTAHNANPLGVLHKAEIINPSEAERRIVNSVMLITEGNEEVSFDEQRDFVATDRVSPKP